MTLEGQKMKYSLLPTDMLSTGGFLSQNPSISDTLFLSLGNVEYLEVLWINKVMGSIKDVKEGWYVPVFTLFLSNNSELHDLVCRSTVNLTTSNLDLLVWASNTPSLLQDQYSEVHLSSLLEPQDYEKWITIRLGMIRVLEACSVSFYIEEKTFLPKHGIIVGQCYLEPVLQHKELKCPFEGCGKLFSRPFNLKLHLETHNPTRKKNHECPECQAQFCRAQDLLRHSQIHNRTMTFICSGCKKSFSRKDALKRHQRTSKACPDSLAFQ